MVTAFAILAMFIYTTVCLWLNLCNFVLSLVTVVSTIGSFLSEMKCYIPTWTANCTITPSNCFKTRNYFFPGLLTIPYYPQTYCRWVVHIQLGSSRNWDFPPCLRWDCFFWTLFLFHSFCRWNIKTFGTDKASRSSWTPPVMTESQSL